MDDENLKEIVITLRVCPKCGFEDPPYWRHARFSYYIDSCRIDDFRIMKPKLAEKLKIGTTMEDEVYIYRLTKSGQYIMRKAISDIGLSSSVWTDGCESGGRKWRDGVTALKDLRKYWSKFHPDQTKLVHFCKE